MQQSQRNKYLIVGGEVILLQQKQDGFFYDDYGTIWASETEAESLDDEVRAGIGIFSIDGYDRQVRGHDFCYSNGVYQAFNTRAEADELLKQHMQGSSWKWPFYILSRLLGGLFWENKKTNR